MIETKETIISVMELFSHCVFLLPSFLASSLTKSFIYGVSAVKSAEWGLGLFLLLYEIKIQYLVSQNLDPRHMTDRTLPVFYPDWNGHLEAILTKQHWLIPWSPEGTRKNDESLASVSTSCMYHGCTCHNTWPLLCINKVTDPCYYP